MSEITLIIKHDASLIQSIFLSPPNVQGTLMSCTLLYEPKLRKLNTRTRLTEGLKKPPTVVATFTFIVCQAVNSNIGNMH